MSRTTFGLLLLVPLAGCGPRIVGSGHITYEDRPLGEDVRIVKLSDVGELTILFGDTPGIEIETDDNILPYVVTTESGHELAIRVKANVSPTAGIKYVVTVKDLNELHLSGAGNATVAHWAGGDVKVRISGAGDLVATDLAVESLSCRLSGAGSLALTGVAKEVELKVSGAGTVQAHGLRAREVKVEVSGAGSAEVFAERELNASVSGAGSVTYLGMPNVRSSVSGSGSVQPAR